MKRILCCLAVCSTLLLAGCERPPKTCELNITQDQLFTEALQDFERISNEVAVRENHLDSLGRQCGFIKCSGHPKWGYVEVSTFSQYISIKEIAFAGYKSPDSTFSCSVAISFSLPDGRLVPHKSFWSLTPSGSSYVLGTIRHSPDPVMTAWIREVTYGENWIGRYASMLATWIKLGLAEKNPRAYGPDQFYGHLDQFKIATGIDYPQRLKDAYDNGH